MAIGVKHFVKGRLKNNNYVVFDDKTKEAILFDCSCADDEIMNWIKDKGLTLKFILLTHGHFDHVLGVNYYKKKYNIPAYLYEKDKALLGRVNEYMDMLGWSRVDTPEVQCFDLTQQFKLGKETIKVIATPGHTLGGVCYIIDGNLFSGDTLFHGACGRTDLIESDGAAMQKSLATLFKQLPDETPVYPGHGATTTIGDERGLY